MLWNGHTNPSTHELAHPIGKHFPTPICNSVIYDLVCAHHAGIVVAIVLLLLLLLCILLAIICVHCARQSYKGEYKV